MQSAVRVAEKVRSPLLLLEADLIPTNSEAAEGWLTRSQLYESGFHRSGTKTVHTNVWLVIMSRWALNYFPSRLQNLNELLMIVKARAEQSRPGASSHWLWMRSEILHLKTAASFLTWDAARRDWSRRGARSEEETLAGAPRWSLMATFLSLSARSALPA